MKKNKEIKKGDKIWLSSPFLAYDSFYRVLSVKKKSTLVEVIVDAEHFDKHYEITMYGHASSSILSGYDRKFGNMEVCYTCDYTIVEQQTIRYHNIEKERDAGRALLNLVKYFK